jgi:hypothetical protein
MRISNIGYMTFLTTVNKLYAGEVFLPASGSMTKKDKLLVLPDLNTEIYYSVLFLSSLMETYSL